MTESPVPITCTYHPDVETSLRCNQCSKPICAKCAIRTPTGYRCRECVRGQQKVFVTAQWVDYVLGGITGFVLSLIASILVVLVSGIAGFFAWLIIAALAPVAAVGISAALRAVTRRHRSRPLFITILVSILLGALPVFLFMLLTMNIWGLIFQGIYLFIAVPTIYFRLSGNQLFKR